jgi:hypothetical protein
MNEMCYATKFINRFDELVKEVTEKYHELSNKQSEVDKKLSEIYHDLELRKFNAAEGYYIAKDLQLVLKQRRIIKSEFTRIQHLMSTMNIKVMGQQLHKAKKNTKVALDGNKEYIANFREEAFEVLQ